MARFGVADIRKADLKLYEHQAPADLRLRELVQEALL
jgi:hypothetical protein